jgi:hypothetical protein
MTRDVDDDGLRGYLLGRMPEAEAEALEEAYFEDPEVLARVRAAEDDLLDDYAAGRLAPDERAAFEGRYQASPPLRRRVLAARALHRAASASDVGGAGRRPLRWQIPVGLAAALLIALLVARMGPWVKQEEARVSPPPTTASPAPSAIPSPATPSTTAPTTAAARLVLALSAVRVRGLETAPELRIPAGAAIVVLELEGSPALQPPRTGRLEVTIETVEGMRVWKGAAAPRAAGGRSSMLASVELSGEALPPGDYIATLAMVRPSETLHRYYFRVVRSATGSR